MTRFSLIKAYEKKYGEAPTRIEAGWLLTADPADIVEFYENFAGPGVEAKILPDGTSTFGAENTDDLIARMVPIYKRAFVKVHGREPSQAELEAVMAVGKHETRFGTFMFPGGVGPGMHNHGAVQCCKPDENGQCPPDAFLSQDSTPTGTSGPNKKYKICFRKYANDEDGAADLIKRVGKTPLALMKENGNSIAAFTLGMYGGRYFEGFNPPPDFLQARDKDIKSVQKLAAKSPGAAGRYRAADYGVAARVTYYANALEKGAEQISKKLGTGRRASKFSISAANDVIVGSVGGAMIGFLLGGPVGAVAGAGAGFLGSHVLGGKTGEKK